MKVGTIRERLLQRVSEALQDGDTDEIFLVSDQLRVVAGALAPLSSEEDVDLATCTVDTAQAARMLSYHAEHVRRLIRQSTIQATKVGADYRIPLREIFAVLVRRHRDEDVPELLPSLRPQPAFDPAAPEAGLELAIDVSISRGRERRTIRIQRFSLDLADLFPELPPHPPLGDGIGEAALT
jgi:excisionase family DNA binding protein